MVVANIKGVRWLIIYLSGSALGLVLLMSSWWAVRELRLRNVEQRYSREFIPGMKRQEIESRLLSEGIRFWPGPPQYEFVSLGEEVRYSIVCAPREVGLMLQFKVDGSTPSGTDLLQSVKPVREERGCA